MNDTSPTTDRYQRGLERMMELVSPEHEGSYDHAKLVESYRTMDEHLADYIVSFAFGDIYSRDSLTQREQTLVTISMLTALGIEPQLRLHIGVGFNVGLTQQQIVGALIHGIPYVGFPRVLNALTLLQEVMAERAATDSPPADPSRTKEGR
jgi:4-carboxymuconolactone decarboxylase